MHSEVGSELAQNRTHKDILKHDQRLVKGYQVKPLYTYPHRNATKDAPPTSIHACLLHEITAAKQAILVPGSF